MEVLLSGKIVSIVQKRLHRHNSFPLFSVYAQPRGYTDTPQQASLTYDRLTYDHTISFVSFPAVHHHLQKRDCPKVAADTPSKGTA
jgi:hypothetical protein